MADGCNAGYFAYDLANEAKATVVTSTGISGDWFNEARYEYNSWGYHCVYTNDFFYGWNNPTWQFDGSTSIYDRFVACNHFEHAMHDCQYRDCSPSRDAYWFQ